MTAAGSGKAWWIDSGVHATHFVLAASNDRLGYTTMRIVMRTIARNATVWPVRADACRCRTLQNR